MTESVQRQRPVTRDPAHTYAQMLDIVTHPAFRIGFLDAQGGKPFDHDEIMTRIDRETPPSALERIGWNIFLFSRGKVELAQWRYEEGRWLHLAFGVCCKGWNHPDFPPAQVRRYIHQQADEAAS
jgi:hypothetical protein